MAGQVSFHR